MLFLSTRSAFLTILLLPCLAVFLTYCASTRNREIRSCSKTYVQPYDVVWKAVEDFIERDLKCIVKTSDKKRGYIETDWVHVLDTDGTKRWMIEAEVKETKTGIQVVLDKRIEFKDEASKQINRYRKEKKDTHEPTATGWKRADIDREELEALYHRIETTYALTPKP